MKKLIRIKSLEIIKKKSLATGNGLDCFISLGGIEIIKKKSLATGNGLDCFISLGGMLRSSKNIYWNGKKFEILNEIDGSNQMLSEKQILDERYTNIGKALEVGALYQYQF